MSNLGIAGFDLFRTCSYPGTLYSDKSSAKYKPMQSQKLKNKKKNSRRNK